MIRSQMYSVLPPEAAMIRQEVFVTEQGFVEEFDEIDKQARHILLFDEDAPIGTCRFFWDEDKCAYIIGRVAIRKVFRGKSFGQRIIQEAEKQILALQGEKVFLAAQVRAKAFYEKQGYTAVGDEFLEEYCPHIWMCKTLQEKCNQE